MRQERFSSSTGERRAILANLVSRRLQTLPSAEDRELVWWLQEISLRELAGPHFVCTSFPAWPADFQCASASSLERIAAKLFRDSRTPVRTKRSGKSATQRHLADFLSRMCLDPNCEFEHFLGFKDLRTALRACKGQIERAHMTAVAETSVNTLVREGLDFCLSQRGIVLMEGTYRSGKSFGAQGWCLERPGRARYVSLGAYTDETSFFRLIGRSVGSAIGLKRKAQEIRHRLDEALSNRDLMLVIDECDYLLPASARPQMAPSRLNYLMADLDNRGVAVALIGSRNFSRTLTNLERKLPNYGAEQFYGRLRLRQQLPGALTESDLFAVAALVLPEANEPTRMLLVGHALTAKGRIAALEHTAKRARFFAEIKRRPLTFADVERAIEESSPQTLSRSKAPAPIAIAVGSGRPLRGPVAEAPRSRGASSPRHFIGRSETVLVPP